MNSKTQQLVKKLLNETKTGDVKWVVRETPKSLNQDTEQSVPLFLRSSVVMFKFMFIIIC
jgi:hypothetical protein